MNYDDAMIADIRKRCEHLADAHAALPPAPAFSRVDVAALLAALDATTAELNEVREQLHRFQHGAEIESDYLCKAALDSLADINARDAAIAERDEARGGKYRSECAECGVEQWTRTHVSTIVCGACTHANMERERDAALARAEAAEAERDEAIAKGIGAAAAAYHERDLLVAAVREKARSCDASAKTLRGEVANGVAVRQSAEAKLARAQVLESVSESLAGLLADGGAARYACPSCGDADRVVEAVRKHLGVPGWKQHLRDALTAYDNQRGGK